TGFRNPSTASEDWQTSGRGSGRLDEGNAARRVALTAGLPAGIPRCIIQAPRAHSRALLQGLAICDQPWKSRTAYRIAAFRLRPEKPLNPSYGAPASLSAFWRMAVS